MYQHIDPGQRHIREERQASDYRRSTLHQHIYTTPDTYIGSVETNERSEWIYNFEHKRLEKAKVTVPEGMVRTFLEIVSNAGDNADASRRFGVDPGSISVQMDREWMVVRSGGEPIPVVVKDDISDEKECKTLIDMIFGELLTSSNYDPNVIKMGCGKNGYGAKLCNIFSHEFIVTVGDAKRGKHHYSRWSANMTKLDSSVTTPPFVYDPSSGRWVDGAGERYTGESFVEVRWKLDFRRFGYEAYPDEVFYLFCRHLIDFSLTCKVLVTFNGESFDLRDIKDYAGLFFDEDACKSAVIHYGWGLKGGGSPPAEVAKLKGKSLQKLVKVCKSVEHIPTVEICVLDTPDAGVCLSFANGLMTMDGGVHVTEAYRSLSSEILAKVNETLQKRSKKGKGKAVPKLNISDVRPHVSVIFNYRAPDPAYSSQSKTVLTKPKPKVVFDPSATKKFEKWKLTDRLYASAEAKIYRNMSKTDGKKKKHVGVKKGEDANEAGGKNSDKCILYLVEGDSASAYPKKRIDMMPGGKDFAGYYPLKGKILNVTKASSQRVAENDEIAAIKKMLGLREGVDYTQPENRSTLRYNFILIVTDADVDGDHIKSLAFNLFHNRYPSILQNGMVGYLQTPIVRLMRGKQIMARFYTQGEFDEWEEKNQGHNFTVKRFKGLGTSKDSDIADDVTTAATVVCIYDEDSKSSLDLAFSGTRESADIRKEWIKRWRTSTGINDIVVDPNSELQKYRSISSVINRDLVGYTIYTLFRAIPSYRDGFKDAQRKATFYMLKKWNYGKSKSGSIKVARIAAAAGDATHYAHGDKSMEGTVVTLGQTYTGANNLGVFMKEGQFGTRSAGGKDAASSRYIESKAEWWIKYAYHKETIDVIPKRMVEGEEAEPEILPCVVPLHVINGALGVATGHSTFIPKHYPIEVIDWLLHRCCDKPTPELTPWYNGFTGKILVKGNKVIADAPQLESEEANESDEEDEAHALAPSVARKRKGQTMHTYGAFTMFKKVHGKTYSKDQDGVCGVTDHRGNFQRTDDVSDKWFANPDGTYNVKVTELPIWRWTIKYRRWLEKMIEEKKIKDFRDNSGPNTVNFTIQGFEGKPTLKSLLLQRSFGMTNMNLIDDNGYPHHFDNVHQIMEAYYISMIDIYRKVIQSKIQKCEEKLTDYRFRSLFVKLVVDAVIIVFKRKKADIHLQMDEHKIPHLYLDKVSLIECTHEELLKYAKIIEDTETELEKLKATTPQKVWYDYLITFREALVKKGYPLREN